jgi:hypothetical protein
MNGSDHAQALAEAQAQQALLDLVEAERAKACAQIDGDTAAIVQAVRAQARAQALLRIRSTFAEQRQRLHDRLAAARARLATQRRLHAQQHTALLLGLAWAQLPGELQSLWQQPAARAAWAAQALSAARKRLPPGAWRVTHAPGWPQAEQQACVDAAGSGVALQFEADAGIAAGLKVAVGGNVIDAALSGLLADRGDFEARLLRRLEDAP